MLELDMLSSLVEEYEKEDLPVNHLGIGHKSYKTP